MELCPVSDCSSKSIFLTNFAWPHHICTPVPRGQWSLQRGYHGRPGAPKKHTNTLLVWSAKSPVNMKEQNHLHHDICSNSFTQSGQIIDICIPLFILLVCIFVLKYLLSNIQYPKHVKWHEKYTIFYQYGIFDTLFTLCA